MACTILTFIVREIIKEKIAELPTTHYDLLEEILNLSWQITKNSSKNLMHSANLSSVLGPSIIRPPANVGAVENLSAANNLMQLLMDEYEYLFQKSIEQAEALNKSALWKLKLYGPLKSIQGLAVAETVVCASVSNLVRVWNIYTYEVVIDIDTGSHIISMCIVGNELWTASDKMIQIWDPLTGTLKAKLETPCCALLRVDIHQVWAASLIAPQVIVYDIATRSIIHTITLNDIIFHLQLVNDTVWGGTGSGSFYVWDIVVSIFRLIILILVGI